jgi:dolichyl-phosphate-mannose--protein O-mannosyl transferase
MCVYVSYGVFVVEYPPEFPVYEIRLVPAVMGSVLVPVVYQIVVELGMSRWAALVAAAFILLGQYALVAAAFILLGQSHIVCVYHRNV